MFRLFAHAQQLHKPQAHRRALQSSARLHRPESVLIVKKRNDDKTLAASDALITYLQHKYPQTSVSIEEEASASGTQSAHGTLKLHRAGEMPDLVVALGGDGTLLHVSSLFAEGRAPPVLAVSLGTLGFLMPHSVGKLERMLDNIIADRFRLLPRMRLRCDVFDASGRRTDRLHGLGSLAMNEVVLHRGRHPHLTIIDSFVDGQHLTEAVADGLIVATPTGSTAYSLSAGGPIVHPHVQSMLLTPICPRSLSFRSVLLPAKSCVQLRISPKSRSPAELSLDGRDVKLITPGEYLAISMSDCPLPCIDTADLASDTSRESDLQHSCGRLEPDAHATPRDGWISDLNSMLSFNKSFASKEVL
ncbi:hypothetical protein E5Q_05500 [Mixia osmundae IAM 14324]|uniref:NAD+ kinase n=1 Tax=Mixia osmundae (strain CBS 9802 / IAM 14324 / JCM 22182 / KY 12970) TaxID=764103 RepID=G7E7K2_MIXOS|nr:hypothetical protein E5Q_05500 [Mixia osmundae IAM 14324]